MMRRTGNPRLMKLILAASLLFSGLTGCVYGPYGPYFDPNFGGECPDGACFSRNSGNSWYDPEGFPSAQSSVPFEQGPYSTTYSDAFGDGYACDGCGAACGGSGGIALSPAEQTLGPSQSRFHPVPTRSVFSDYTPATYEAPLPVAPYPVGESEMPAIENEPRHLPSAAPGTLPPPPLEIPISEPTSGKDKLTRLPIRRRRRGDSWLFLPQQSPNGAGSSSPRVASPRHHQAWY